MTGHPAEDREAASNCSYMSAGSDDKPAAFAHSI